jgi:hypothetical protein
MAGVVLCVDHLHHDVTMKSSHHIIIMSHHITLSASSSPLSTQMRNRQGMPLSMSLAQVINEWLNTSSS